MVNSCLLPLTYLFPLQQFFQTLSAFSDSSHTFSQLPFCQFKWANLFECLLIKHLLFLPSHPSSPSQQRLEASCFLNRRAANVNTVFQNNSTVSFKRTEHFPPVRLIANPRLYNTAVGFGWDRTFLIHSKPMTMQYSQVFLFLCNFKLTNSKLVREKHFISP